MKAELYAPAPGMAEGPAWHSGGLYFCSWGLRRVGPDGKPRRVLDISPAGTYGLPDGRLLICDNRHDALLVLEKDGRVGVLADRWNGKKLRLLNDLTVDRAGGVYWTDSGKYDAQRPSGNVFRLTPSSMVSRIATGLAFPNGIEVDPAGRYLYVVESAKNRILRYTVPPPDRPLGPPTVFYKYRTSGDGLAFDASGNLWVAEFLGGEVVALSPQGQTVMTVKVPAKSLSNLCFGGPRRDALFVTTGMPNGVFRIPLGIRGFAGHPGARRYRVLRYLSVQASAR